MEAPRPLTEQETKIVRIFKQAAENHAAVKGIKTQWSIYHLSREAGLDLSNHPKEGLVIQAVWIAFLSVMKSHTPECELKYPTLHDFQAAYNGRFDGYNSYELNNLFQIANWMAVLFTFVPAKKNKGFALTIVTKLIEGWYIKYVTGSGQTKATQDRVHIFEVEGNTKPSPRGTNKSLAAANEAGHGFTLKLRSPAAGDDGASQSSSSSFNTATTSNSYSSASANNSPTMLLHSPDSPVSSPRREGDQGIGHAAKRRRSQGKSSTSFPAFGPENTLFQTHASFGSSPPKTSGFAPAPQPAPAVATLHSVLYSNGVSGLRNNGKPGSRAAHAAAAAAGTSAAALPVIDNVPLFRSISNPAATAAAPQHSYSNYRVIDSGASDLTDYDDNYMTETDIEDMSMGLCPTGADSIDACVFEDTDTFLTLADMQVCAAAGDVGDLVLNDSHDDGDDAAFQDMLKLLRESSGNYYRQNTFSVNDTTTMGSCCLGLPETPTTPFAKTEINFAAVPVEVTLSELGPPLELESPRVGGVSGFLLRAFDLYGHEQF